MITISAVVCDDDINALNSEAELIESLFKEKGIIYTLDRFNEPKKLWNTVKAYDMVFLDIEMYEMNGIDLARHLTVTGKPGSIFFITNYSVYLDKAFDVNAVRFLSKPVDAIRLNAGIDVVLERMEAERKIISLTLLKNKLEVSVEVNSIIYIANTGRHTLVTTTGHGEFEAEEVFSFVKNTIEKEVNYFAMPHQSFYVNLNYVVNCTKDTVIMKYAGKRYKAYMTRRRYKEFEEKLFIMAKKQQ